MPSPSPHVIAIIGPQPPRELRPWLRREHGLRWWPRQDEPDEPAFVVRETVTGEAELGERPCRFRVGYGERWIDLHIEQDGQWAFRLDAGGRSIRLLGEWPPATVLLGPPLLLALALAGRFCLHASAISVDGRVAWLLSAPSGTGKSTVAASARALGWQRLCDDLAPLLLDAAGTAWLLPRLPQLKLGPAATTATVALPCNGILALRRGPQGTLLPLADGALLALLLSSTVASRLFDRRLSTAHLDWATRLCSRTGGLPAWQLQLAERATDPCGAAQQALALLPTAAAGSMADAG